MRRCGMRKIKFLSMLVLAIVITSLVTSIAYAYAAYHGNWPEQPYWGNWWWYNYGYLYWDVADLWTPSGVNALRSGPNNFPWKEYRFEREAYNPGAGTSCDRLQVYVVYAGQPPTWNLPITYHSIRNSCGSSAVKELVHLELDEIASAQTYGIGTG